MTATLVYTPNRTDPCKTFDARNKATSFSYDGSGYLTAVARPAPLGGESMSYDTYGRMETVNDGKGQVRTFTYDKIGRLTNTDYDGAVTIGYGYDPAGNQTSRDDNGTAWAMAFDEANRITSIDGPPSPVGYPNLNDTSFTYDTVGNLKTLTDTGGTTGYTFTEINMVHTITDPDSGITTYNYDRPGHHDWVTSIDYPNGARSAMEHDNDGRTTNVTNTERVGGSGNGGVMLDLTYKFGTGDNKSVRTKVTSPSDSTVYGYDELNRLTSATTTLNGGGTTSSYTYSYDGAGNRKTSKVGATTATFSYNNADQLTTPGVVHDANGNMTAGGAHGFTAQVFNELDQATSVTPKAQAARAQTYGGQLQSTWLSDATTRFGTAGSVGITAMSDGTTTTSFVRDPSGRLISMKRGANRSYYHYDGRGSIDSLTNSDGNQAQRYRYEPYGRLTTGTIGTIDQPFRWNAEYAINDYDYKVGARRYDASIARWTQTDPSGQETNNYAYANNDPVNRADSSGLSNCGWSLGGAVDCAARAGNETVDRVKAGIDSGGKLATGEAVAGAVIGCAVTAFAGCWEGAGVGFTFGGIHGALTGFSYGVITGDSL